MSFLDIQFPAVISYGSTGGPKYQISVISMRSGQEKRNINWDYPRHEYNAATGIRRFADLEDLIAFFHIAEGRGHSFRWKDWWDFKSRKTKDDIANDDQSLGDTDGSIDDIQLVKTYTYGGYSRQSRLITKPVAGTLVLALDGLANTDWTLDTDTGLITWDYDTWAITGVDTGAKTFDVAGDQTGTIQNGDNIDVTGSTGNDGVYTVSGTSHAGGTTTITVSESIADATVDGNVNHGQPNSGQAITAGYEFDVHARFDTDELETNYQHYQIGSAEVPIIEIKGTE